LDIPSKTVKLQLKYVNDIKFVPNKLRGEVQGRDDCVIIIKE